MRSIFTIVALAMAGTSEAGEVTITNRAIGIPVKVEYVDTGVNGVTRTLYLDPRESKNVRVNLDIRLTVYDKGMGRRRASGTFKGAGRVLIEREGTRWVLKHTR